MKLVTLLLIWLAFKVIVDLADRKKGRLPPPENSPDLNTPTIANDPNFPGEEVPIFIENPRQAEIRSRTKPAAQIWQKISNQEVQEKTDELDLNLTPSNVMNAFVLGEILGKPKALRR